MNRIVTDPEHRSTPRHFALGDAVFDRFTRTLSVAGREHRLEPRLAGVLECLMAEAGIPVTRETLLDQVWGQDGSDEALTQSVSRLRRMLGASCEIRTMPKIGYVLMADPVPVERPDMARETDETVAARQSRSSRSIPMWAGIVIGALGMALAGVIIFFVFFGFEREIEFITVEHPLADEAVTTGAD